MSQVAPVAEVADDASDSCLPFAAKPIWFWQQRDSGRAVNIKKGQFLAPHDARNIVDKARAVGCEKLMLTERGVSFGYNNLVVDMRSFPILAVL